jgi:ribosome-associated protein
LTKPDPTAEPAEAPLSKTRRKLAMHALQDLGEALVGLDDAKLSQVDLPERLRDAVVQARSITKHEARRRQMQFIGRLMRDIDPEPVRLKLAAWEGRSHEDTARLHRLERERAALLAHPEGLEALCARHPEIDRTHWRALIARARDEQQSGQPPRAYRQLFRELRALSTGDTEALE